MKKTLFCIIFIAAFLLAAGCSPNAPGRSLQSPEMGSSVKPGPTDTLHPPERTPLPMWYATDYDYYMSAYENTKQLEKYEFSGKLDISTEGRISLDIPFEFDGKIIVSDETEELLFHTSSNVFGLYDAVDVYYKDGLSVTEHITKVNGNEVRTKLINDDHQGKDADALKRTDIAFPVSEDDILSAAVNVGEGYTEYTFVKSGREIRELISHIEKLSISESISLDEQSAQNEFRNAAMRLADIDFDEAIIYIRIDDSGIISAFGMTAEYVREDRENGNTNVRIRFDASLREMSDDETIEPIQ